MESIKTRGQFLHTSLQPHPASEPDAGCFEVNVSVTQSAYTIVGHASYSLAESSFFRGGDIVQLFHKEMSAYVCAEGSPSTPKPVEDIHLRRRPIDITKPRTLVPPTSCVSYWQVRLPFPPQP
jgi:inositol 1,4,5-triphosphate receptor type 1